MIRWIKPKSDVKENWKLWFYKYVYMHMYGYVCMYVYALFWYNWIFINFYDKLYFKVDRTVKVIQENKAF